MQIIKRESPNFNDRRDNKKPEFLILHYTGMESGQEALEHMCDECSEVSAHYMIDYDGTVTQLVDEGKRAWHAGVSYWDGETDLNSASIGIEIVNKGHEFGYEEFTEEQMKSLIALSKEILSRHDISSNNVIAHSDIAPDRKQDPGEKFDWKRMSNEGIGAWVEPIKEDFYKAASLLNDEAEIKDLLTGYGYNPKLSFNDLIMAFQRHFQPDSLGRGADIATIAKLNALCRFKNNIS